MAHVSKMENIHRGLVGENEELRQEIRNLKQRVPGSDPPQFGQVLRTCPGPLFGL